MIVTLVIIAIISYLYSEGLQTWSQAPLMILKKPGRFSYCLQQEVALEPMIPHRCSYSVLNYTNSLAECGFFFLLQSHWLFHHVGRSQECRRPPSHHQQEFVWRSRHHGDRKDDALLQSLRCDAKRLRATTAVCCRWARFDRVKVSEGQQHLMTLF